MLSLLATLAWVIGASAAPVTRRADLPQPPALAAVDASLPVELNAAYSEFDRRNNRLVFRNLRVTQGSMVITADEATADPADFEDSVWVFTGKVSFDNAGTVATCDRAEMTFRSNRLRKAVLTGAPAKFVQPGTGGSASTEGRGRSLVYDLDAATIRMTNDAFISDGTNEITGSSIAYDLQREVVSAGSGSTGPVRMKITPKKGSGPATRVRPTGAPAP